MVPTANHNLYECMGDEEVVIRAQKGAPDATEHLIDRYRGLVESRARAYFVLGADREDVIQEGMIGLCKAIRDYRDERLQRFKPFAELCVTRQIITAVKAATRHKHSPLNGSVSLDQTFGGEGGDGSLLDLLPDPRNRDVVDTVANAELPKKLDAFIESSLSDLERGVLQRYVEGQSYREMSDQLHCQTKSIDNALQRVKKKIGGLLATCDV